MDSVFVFLRSATQAGAAAHLDTRYPVQRDPWVALAEDDAALFISFIDSLWTDLWPELIQQLGHTLRGTARCVVSADIAGRHFGCDLPRKFAIDLLQKFEGVALNDITDHLWTLDELRRNHRVDGYGFAERCRYDSMSDAFHLARQVASGSFEPHFGCSMFVHISEALWHPRELQRFADLHQRADASHETDRRALLADDIRAACRDLLAGHDRLR